MNARQAKKKAKNSLIVDSKKYSISTKNVISRVKKGKRAVIKKVKEAEWNKYEDIFRSGFARLGIKDPLGDELDSLANTGMATSIRNNVQEIGKEKCPLEYYKDLNWADIVGMALNELDESDIKNNWVSMYFRVAPTYGAGETDATIRYRVANNYWGRYITQPGFGREVFLLWAQLLENQETGKIPGLLVDMKF